MKVAAVTGGARGIGLSTCEALARQGYRIAIGDIDLEPAEAAAATLPDAKAWQLDVTSSVSMGQFVADVEADLGPIDVFVNNAGIMPTGAFLDQDEDAEHALVAINLHGPANGMRAVLPSMIARGSGHIVNVSSYAGKAPIPGLSMYCASKTGLVALSETVRQEIEKTGVTLSVVMPSAVATELSSGIDFPFEKYAKVTPEQVAKAIVKTIGKKRAREVAVPRWMGLYEPISAVMPYRVGRFLMGALGADSKVAELDTATRLTYQTRLDSHIKSTTPSGG